MNRRLAASALACALLAGCGGVYSLEYMTRVLTRQDANTDDFRWKRFIDVAAARAPTPLPAGDESAALAALSAQLGDETLDAFMARTGTQSLMVMQGGRVVLERYGAGHDAATPQATFSVSKSILSLLVGQALQAGIFRSLDDPITTYLPELRARDPRFDSITLAHLIDMRSGIGFDDETGFPFVTEDEPLVYYATDLRNVVLTQTRIEANPGTFLYNDYNPNLLALALERAASAERLAQMRQALWSQLGAEKPAGWSADNHGFPYWESGFVATARDLARVGLLMLDEDGSPLLSEAWRTRILAYTPSQPIEMYNGSHWAYRGGWWLILRPNGRHDVAAIGRFGQLIYVSPANGVVMVRTGSDENPPTDGSLTRLFYALATELGAAPETAAAGSSD